MTAFLSWDDPAAELRLFLEHPTGERVASSTSGADGSASLDTYVDTPGTWRLDVRARSGSSPYRLELDFQAGPRVLRLWSPENEVYDLFTTPQEAVAEAERFDLITAPSGSYRSYVADMQAANPRLILLAYVNGTFVPGGQGQAHPPSWYSNDARGDKIRSTGYGNYLMNPSHPGWIRNRVELCCSLIAQSGYQGCMLDVLGTAPLQAGYATGLPVNPATGQVWAPGDWSRATARLAAEVKEAVRPALVFGNGLRDQALDGTINESWLRSAGQSIDAYPSQPRWQRDVDLLKEAAQAGKPLLVLTKTWVQASLADKDDWHRYALASFLLGSDGTSYFSFSYARNHDVTAGHRWWDLHLGIPVGDYRKAGDVYQRDFTQGKVLVNPTGRTLSVSLGTTYVDLDGREKSATTLPPHTAEILRIP